MSLAGLLLFLVTVASIGRMSQAFAERNRGTRLRSVMVSLLGAVLGFWLAHHFGLGLISGTQQANIFPVLWAVSGSVIFSLLMTLITRGGQFLFKRFHPSAPVAPVRGNLFNPKH